MITRVIWYLRKKIFFFFCRMDNMTEAQCRIAWTLKMLEMATRQAGQSMGTYHAPGYHEKTRRTFKN